jgi:ribosomal protein S18 acetylase RimI-like enzyme
VGLTIRAARVDDLPALLEFWRSADVHPGHTDDLDSLRRLVERDPDALVVAEEAGRLVGSVIAAWDGWRGTIYRLAVAPSHRRGGVGRTLLRHAEARLGAVGAARCQAIVVDTDPVARAFWRASDWDEQVERLRFTKG